MIDPLASRVQSQFSTMLRGIFGEYLKDNMRTSVPASILEFDPSTQLAKVQIGLMIEDELGAQEAREPSIMVPVQFCGGAGGHIEFKLERGDEGVLMFSQECIDSWVDQGGVAVKSELRRFSANDCYFLPGVRSIPNAITGFSNDGVRIRNKPGTSYAWLKDSGEVSMRNGAGYIDIAPSGVVTINGVTFTPDGLVETPNDMVAGTVSLKTHTHIGVQGGNGTSGVPVQ